MSFPSVAVGASHTNTADTATTLIAAASGNVQYRNAYLAAETKAIQFSLDGGTTWLPVALGTRAELLNVVISGAVQEKNVTAGQNGTGYAIVS